MIAPFLAWAMALSAQAAVAPATAATRPPEEPKLAVQLGRLRRKVITLEQSLIEGLRAQSAAKANVKKIQALIRLQREEKELGRKRVAELEKTVGELEIRRGALGERIQVQQKSLRKFLTAIDRSSDGAPAPMPESVGSLMLAEQEKIEAPRRKTLANLVDRGLKEIEMLKADLTDADQLQGHIEEEKQQLAYLFQDLQEQESILELNRQLQVDVLRRKHHERLAQLENYRKLKTSESQVEQLIGEFNARKELERAAETEREASSAMMKGEFARLKGRLGLPVTGQVLTGFGRTFDAKSRLYIFKKGIDIAAGKNLPVHAVYSGRVAFSGELPDYGRVTIIDHGEHFYTLCAHLGALSKKAGEPVAVGERIGLTDNSATPVYFEIRSRNVAVNPLQWITN
ncbi:MAG: murein hydrolase activator EnvC family protein [Bdellovibrionota bacterium]